MRVFYPSTTGLNPDDTDDSDDSDDVKTTGSVLDDLNNRFEDEKEALLARLRGTNRHFAIRLEGRRHPTPRCSGTGRRSVLPHDVMGLDAPRYRGQMKTLLSCGHERSMSNGHS